MTASRRRVTIIHPWLPQYRIPFFKGLRDSLESQDIELTVAYGPPPPDSAGRSDLGELAEAVPLVTRRISFGQFDLIHHEHSQVTTGRDLVVVEHAIRNAETYRLLAARRRRGQKVATWGHGGTYGKEHPAPLQWLKREVGNRADWFFAYTAGGAERVIAGGFPRSRTTVVQNATDTGALRRAVAALTDADVAQFRNLIGLANGPTGVYIGALSASKRLDFLLESGQRVRESVPGFQLVLVGDGPLLAEIRKQADPSWVRICGPLFGTDLAPLARIADLVLNPGLVGLAIVDSFALGLPMITTDWPFHSPECEYLEHGVNGWKSLNTMDSFASDVTTILQNPTLLESLRGGTSRSAQTYTMEEMVQRFATGAVEALDAAPRWQDSEHQLQ